MEKKERRIINEMRSIGRDLFLRGLVGSHSGNMSVLVDEEIYITRTKSMLGRLKREDIVRVPLVKLTEEVLKIASSEISVHLSIYKNTDAKAILHAHPPYAVILSLISEEIEVNPCDYEGKLILGSFHILSTEGLSKEERAERIAFSLQKSKAVVEKGHGSFAKGDSLEEAYMYTTSLESSSFFQYHLETLVKRRGR
ncbi:MAG: class II aldolase/adducin family protein [Desulfobacterota bacterium]|nr:class II aldolase/adducin family protein [Thermodesulfobacteriota bacterium]MDW8001474.1 class II aldolase/adducin family protein [Deltaproteobacteria bacterium]